MLKELNVALIFCPVGFFEAIIAVFQKQKSQIHPENDKNSQNFLIFKDFIHFSPFSTEFVN